MQVASLNFQPSAGNESNLQKELSAISQLNTAIVSKLENSSSLNVTDFDELTALSAIFNITLNRACEVVSKIIA